MLAAISSSPPAAASDESTSPVRRGWWLGKLAAAASLMLCAAAGAAYYTRADAVAAVTVCPPWAWSLFGFAAAGLAAILRSGRRPVIIAVLAWAAYLVATADTPAALFRKAPARSDKARGIEPPRFFTVRVISFNCSLGNADAVRDLKRFRPQIVLLQESPGRADLAELADELFADQGAFVQGSDASVLARGAVTASDVSADHHGAVAHVRLANGVEVAVISLRLEPALVRLDYWSPQCWRSQAENRRVRRRQLAAVMEPAAEVRPAVPLLVGGDFNAPAGDAVFRLLQPRLRDAFGDAGVGWGNTITSDFPFARIDQIWIDRHWQAVAVQAHPSAYSDHRIVIADLLLQVP